MSEVRIIRQGDVLLRRVDPPKEATLVEGAAGLRIPGERTGHAHELPAEVYSTPNGRLLHVTEPTPMTHQEHAHVTVPAGWYEPILQTEFVPASRPALRAQFD